MDMDRRHLLTLTSAAAGAGMASTMLSPAPAAATPISALGVDASHFGVSPGRPDDQTKALQRAIDQAASSRLPLALMPGLYLASDLTMPAGTQIVGVRGATRLVSSRGRPLLTATNADAVSLSGLILDGGGKRLPEQSGLVFVGNSRGLRITDCEITDSGQHGIMLEGVEGEISGTTIAGAADVAILSLDARGLLIARNIIRRAGNNGIQILRHVQGEDGTMIIDNRVEDVNDSIGGSGQFGNGINAHRAGSVIVRGNRIRGCAFSAVRGNAASNIQIVGNSCSDLGEVALYSEFGFEGAVIAHNTVDAAQVGVSVCNFNEGGRLAIVQGNIFRNLRPRRRGLTHPDEAQGLGINVEADTAVTGNVVENASSAGIQLGWGPYLRDVTVTGNVVRGADIGIAVSVVPGGGSALIADNLISGARRGAIVGMNKENPVSGDLSKDGATRYAQLTITGNRAP